MLTWISMSPPGQSVEPLPQQVQQRDRRELAQSFAIPGQARTDRFGRDARQREREAHRPDRDTVLFGRPGDPRHRDADVGAEHTLRAPAISRAAASLTTDSAVTPETERFTSVA